VGSIEFVRVLSLNYRVNMLGLASALLLLYTASSNKPWWIMTGGLGGKATFSAEISPFSIAIEILGKPVIVPILPYLNLAARLSILLAAITMFIGSLLAKKPWSKPLISLKGLILPIIFLCGLLIGLASVRAYVGVSPPLIGEFVLRYEVQADMVAETPVMTTLTQEYWIALAAGMISALARVVQGKIAAEGH